MQEKASSANFALLGRTYLRPSSHVPATVLARTCKRPCTSLQASLHVLATVLARTCIRPRTYLRGKDDNNLFFLLTPGIHIPKLAGKKKTVSPMGHSLICMYEDVFF